MFLDVKLVLYRPIAPKVICIVLILLTVWQVFVGVTSYFSLDKVPSVRHDLVSEAKIKEKKTLSNENLNTAFFGDYVPNNLNEVYVKQSMLDLKIVGIMFATSEKESHVVVSTASGNEQTFFVGDSLPGGAIIKRITPDGVLILRNGALESLSLPKNALTFEAPAKPLENSQ